MPALRQLISRAENVLIARLAVLVVHHHPLAVLVRQHTIHKELHQVCSASVVRHHVSLTPTLQKALKLVCSVTKIALSVQDQQTLTVLNAEVYYILVAHNVSITAQTEQQRLPLRKGFASPIIVLRIARPVQVRMLSTVLYATLVIKGFQIQVYVWRLVHQHCIIMTEM